MEWGLQTLPFHRSLWIGAHKEERLESFPEEQFLPSTLTSLTIGAFPNLKSLDNKGLQYLISLETLYILNCEKLKSFPKHGLPSSLSRLNISKRPLLKKRCQRDKGKEWPKICHIPCIVIEEEFILSWGPCSIQALAFSAIIDSGTYFLLLFIFCTIDAHKFAFHSHLSINSISLTVWLTFLL